MLRKILLAVLTIASLFLVYLAGGYLVRGITQPYLVGNNQTFYFFGFYILAIVYSLGAVLVIIITVLIFFKFRRTQ